MQRLFLKLIFLSNILYKTFEKVDDTFNLKNLFTEHVNKFNFKNEQEFYLLDDIKYKSILLLKSFAHDRCFVFLF